MQAKYLDIFMPPLIAKWQQLPNSDKDLFPLLECFTSIAQVLLFSSVGRQSCSFEVWTCFTLVSKVFSTHVRILILLSHLWTSYGIYPWRFLFLLGTRTRIFSVCWASVSEMHQSYPIPAVGKGLSILYVVFFIYGSGIRYQVLKLNLSNLYFSC